MLNPYYWLLLGLESAAGSTIYALLNLLILSGATLALQIRARDRGVDRATNLAFLALLGLRLVESAIFGRAGLGGEGVQLIPAIERGVLLLSIVVFAWLWLRLIPGKVAGGFLGISLGLAALGTTALVWIGGSTSSSRPFNYSPLDYSWSGLCVLVLASGLVLLLQKRAEGWRQGVIQLVILVLGVLSHALLAEPGASMPLGLQVANLVALPVLAFLPLPSLAADGAAEPPNGGQDARGQSAEASSIDWAIFCEELCLALEADLCLIGHLDLQHETLESESGYNASSGGRLPSFSFGLAGIPQVASALGQGRSLRLAGGQQHSDLGQLANTLGLPMEGNLLAAPIADQDSETEKAVLLIRLATAWLLDEEQELVGILRGESRPRGTLGSRQGEEGGWEEEFSWLSDGETENGEEPGFPIPAEEGDSEARGLLGRLAELEEENEHYRQEVERLLAHIERISGEQADGGGLETMPGDGPALIGEILPENEELKTAAELLERSDPIPGSLLTLEQKQVQEELRLAMQEIARLQAVLNQAKDAPAATPRDVENDGKMPAEKAELIASVAQDLRQPLSSILGYTDLLLGESVGILGALQRSFLERVRGSTERMNRLIGDLVHIAELDIAAFEAMGKTVDPTIVIKDALDLVQGCIQEKQIALQVDVLPALPELPANRDALQQIIFHLLKNACDATPSGRQMMLRATKSSREEPGEFVLIQVSDSGGGVREDDLPRVFSRIYRSTNPLIEGVGDTGVGLSIAEILTKALGGRIWVESEHGVGATFSILLPSSPNQPTAA